MKRYMLTTVDNPYNPFTQFDEWYSYDLEFGYDSCGYFSRVVRVSSAMTDDQIVEACNEAIDEIVQLDPFGIYIKVPEPE